MPQNSSDRNRRLKPQSAYDPTDGSVGTYRSTLFPEDIAEPLRNQTSAWWQHEATRKSNRLLLWQNRLTQTRPDRDREVQLWEAEARHKRQRLASLLGLKAAPELVRQDQTHPGAGRSDGGEGERAYPLFALVLQDGSRIRIAGPLGNQTAGNVLAVLPPRTTLEAAMAGDDPSAGPSPASRCVVELPVFVAADDRLGKALLLRNETILGTAAAQLHRVVSHFLAREEGEAIRPALAGDGLAGLLALLYTALDLRVAGVYADLTSLEPEWPGEALIPRFNLHFDLESVVHLCAPRPVWLQGRSSMLAVEYAQAAHMLLGMEAYVNVIASEEASQTASVPSAAATNWPRAVTPQVDTGVVLAYEGYVENVVNTPARMKQLLDDVGSPALQVVMDPNNYFEPELSEAFQYVSRFL